MQLLLGNNWLAYISLASTGLASVGSSPSPAMNKVLLLSLAFIAVASCESNVNGTGTTAETSLPALGQYEIVGVTSGIFDSFDGKVRHMEQACANLDYTFRKYFW